VCLLLGQGKVEDAEVIFFGLRSANEYQPVNHLTTFHHSGLLGSPESRVYNSCSVSSCCRAEEKISDCSGFSSFENEGCGRDEDAEECSVSPEGDGISEFARST